MQQRPRRVYLLLCGVGFLASEMVLQSTLWPRWGPTVAVLAGLVPLAIFAWIAKRLNPESKENDLAATDRPGRSKTAKLVLGSLMAVAWITGMVSWFPGAEMERAALSQPDHPTAQFTQPMNLKGVTRYVTPQQYRIAELAKWSFLGSWAVCLSSILLYRWLERRGRIR
ncbi:MAG TPA: hypothetical protein VGG69_01450 [Rhizomicrobium sp.]|jgi:hypothetical protein